MEHEVTVTIPKEFDRTGIAAGYIWGLVTEGMRARGIHGWPTVQWVDQESGKLMAFNGEGEYEVELPVVEEIDGEEEEEATPPLTD